MAYHDEDDIRAVAHTARITEFADADKDGVADADVLAAAIAASDARVFSALAGRYPSLVPSAVTPGTVNQGVRYCAAVFSVWHLASHQFRAKFSKTYNEWKDWLDSVRDGLNLLGTVGTAALVESTTRTRLRTYRERGPIGLIDEPPPGTTNDPTENTFFQATPEENEP